jgi:hypothetical protein
MSAAEWSDEELDRDVLRCLQVFGKLTEIQLFLKLRVERQRVLHPTALLDALTRLLLVGEVRAVQIPVLLGDRTLLRVAYEAASRTSPQL